MNKDQICLVFVAIGFLASQTVSSQNNYGRSAQTGGTYGQSAQANGVSSQTNGGYGVPTQTGAYGNQYGYGHGQYIGAPNATYGGGGTGYYPYGNQSGYGYYGANRYAGAFPALGAPVPIDGGMYRFNVGGFNGTYWKSPSGYYYPWGAGAVYSSPPPIININQGSSQPAQPPIPDMLKDMSTYIDEQNTKKKFKPDDYIHLARRAKDLQSKESMFRSRNGGTLDSNDEENLRKDCAMLSGDISRRVIP